MKKTELPEALKKNSTELSRIGKAEIEIEGKIYRVPQNKLQTVQKAAVDPISLELIKSGRFEIRKYEQSLINWPLEFGKIRVSNISDCFDLPTPSLATIRKYKGEFKTIAAICKMIEEVYSFFNVTNTLNDIQLQMSASLVLSEYYFLTIADIRLCFFNAYKNKYGKLYNRLDGSIILEWLEKYTEERALEAQRLSEKKSSEEKSETFSPEAAAKFKEIFESVKDIKTKSSGRIIYSSFGHYSDFELDEKQIQEIEEAIKEAYKFIVGMDYDFESFRTWRKNTILFRINKGDSLPDILEGIKAAKI